MTLTIGNNLVHSSETLTEITQRIGSYTIETIWIHAIWSLR